MNVIRLMGGLGNQLFQYALGRAMKENGIKVAFDIYKFVKNKKREYMLGKFTLDVPFSIFVNDRGILDTGANPSFNMSYLRRDGYNYFGYWQYLQYFEKILPILRKEIWVREELYNDKFLELRDIVQNSNSVSIHVRRDDYVTSDSIPCLPFSYYYDAVNYTEGDLYVFSDDIKWCRKYFVEDYFERKITFVDLPYYLDFEIMKLCKQSIISNSTFSWWAAILSGNKVVVTPNFWITRLDRHNRNNFPKKWIQLECDV